MIKARKRKEILRKIIIYSGLILFALFVLVPFAIMLISSLKHKEETIGSFTWWPKLGMTLKGYVNAFEKVASSTSILEGFVNTMWIIIPPTVLGLLVSTLAAYAFAKMRFRGKNVMFGLLIATMMVPGIVTLVPSYIIWDYLGITMTAPYVPLMIPGMFGAAACVFFMRQAIFSIPDSVIEASRLDGMGPFGCFVKIVLPLVKPALLSQGILGFVAGYNDYFGPLIYLKSDYQTLQIAVSVFSDRYSGDWPSILAANVVAIIPTVMIYVFVQKYFIEGITAGGEKG
ncbi:MAG: carbohydrate ABC transporter permease [Oscillospiraceae bacterium]|nr:carbohydrate ABC transporter permease [Oscillospiraceae bacterium]